MTKGIKYLLEPISNDNRILKLNINLDQGNYLIRDTESNGKIEEFVAMELSYSYLLSLPKSKVLDLEGAEACPIHIIKQLIINE